MRYLMLAVVMLIGLVSFPRTAAAVDAPMLSTMALSASDIGGGYEALRAGPVEDLDAAGIANYSAAFAKIPSLLNPTITVVGVVLMDADAASAAGTDPAGGIESIGQFGLQATPAGSAGLGEESQRYTLIGEIMGIKLNGEAITWKHGAVIAAVVIMSNSGAPSATSFAAQQDTKITAALG